MDNNKPSLAQTAGGKAWWEEPLRIFASLSGWVLVPLIVAYGLGRWLDNRYNTAPRYFFITIGCAFVLSVAGMIRQARAEYKKFDVPKK